MKYYATIRNTLGEQCLFAECASKEEAQAALAPLLRAGFPKDSTRVIRACTSKDDIGHYYLRFILTDGQLAEYSLHSKNGRREFMIAAELILNRKFKYAAAVELHNCAHYCLGRFELPTSLMN